MTLNIFIGTIVENLQKKGEINSYEQLEEVLENYLADNQGFNLNNFSDNEISQAVDNSELNDDSKKNLKEAISLHKAKIKVKEIDKKDHENIEVEKRNIITNILQELTETSSIVQIDFENKKVCIENINFETMLSKHQLKQIWEGENLKSSFSMEKGVPEEKIFQISSLSEFLERLSYIDVEENLINFLSRGQKDCRYHLSPSIMRFSKKVDKQKENLILNNFKNSAVFYEPKIGELSEESLRAYGQHFGLPTHFLDFTQAHLLSLFFSVEEYNYFNNASVVYLINATAVNQENINIERRTVDLQKDNDNYSDKSFFIKVEDSNERIHFQKGCFLKVNTQDVRESTENGEGGELTSMKKILENNTYAFLIEPENKKKILKELFAMGITYESIYPNIESLTKNIRFELLEQGE